jgi:hypothetical protein
MDLKASSNTLSYRGHAVHGEREGGSSGGVREGGSERVEEGRFQLAVIVRRQVIGNIT